MLRTLVAFILAAPLAVAAQYPNKPIRLIVPFPPGGEAELGARIYEPKSSTPEELAAFVKEQREIWRRAVAEAGIKPE